MGLASERIIPQELNDWKYTTQSQENIKACVNGLSARESEAILVIKQLEDQVPNYSPIIILSHNDFSPYHCPIMQ